MDLTGTASYVTKGYSGYIQPLQLGKIVSRARSLGPNVEPFPPGTTQKPSTFHDKYEEVQEYGDGLSHQVPLESDDCD